MKKKCELVTNYTSKLCRGWSTPPSSTAPLITTAPLRADNGIEKVRANIKNEDFDFQYLNILCVF